MNTRHQPNNALDVSGCECGGLFKIPPAAVEGEQPSVRSFFLFCESCVEV